MSCQHSSGKHWTQEEQKISYLWLLLHQTFLLLSVSCCPWILAWTQAYWLTGHKTPSYTYSLSHTHKQTKAREHTKCTHSFSVTHTHTHTHTLSLSLSLSLSLISLSLSIPELFVLCWVKGICAKNVHIALLSFPCSGMVDLRCGLMWVVHAGVVMFKKHCFFFF